MSHDFDEDDNAEPADDRMTILALLTAFAMGAAALVLFGGPYLT